MSTAQKAGRGGMEKPKRLRWGRKRPNCNSNTKKQADNMTNAGARQRLAKAEVAHSQSSWFLGKSMRIAREGSGRLKSPISELAHQAPEALGIARVQCRQTTGAVRPPRLLPNEAAALLMAGHGYHGCADEIHKLAKPPSLRRPFASGNCGICDRFRACISVRPLLSGFR